MSAWMTIFCATTSPASPLTNWSSVSRLAFIVACLLLFGNRKDIAADWIHGRQEWPLHPQLTTPRVQGETHG